MLALQLKPGGYSMVISDKVANLSHCNLFGRIPERSCYTACLQRAVNDDAMSSADHTAAR